MSHSPDTAEVFGAYVSGGAVTLSTVAPHPLQIVAWIIAIVAGVFTIYRAVQGEKRARAREVRAKQLHDERLEYAPEEE